MTEEHLTHEPNKQKALAKKFYDKYLALCKKHLNKSVTENQRYGDNFIKSLKGIRDNRVLTELAKLYMGGPLPDNTSVSKVIEELIADVTRLKKLGSKTRSASKSLTIC